MIEVSDKTIKLLYEYLLETQGQWQLHSKDMIAKGLNYKRIKELMDGEVLVKIKNGYYALTDKGLEGFFYYGKFLIAQKEKEQADLCFRRCLEINPNYLGACFQLFLNNIQNKNYEKAFELYEKLLTSPNAFYAIDMKYYLYLLSFITEIPEKYREITKNIKYKDLEVPIDDKRFKEVDSQNDIRMLVSKGKLSMALSRLMHLISNHKKSTVQDIIAKALLEQALNAEKENKNQVIKLIKEGKIEEVQSLLLKNLECHPLCKLDRYTLRLVQKYLEMEHSSTLLEEGPLDDDSIFSAIKANKFSLALEKSREFDENNSLDNEVSTFSLLLTKICELVQRIKDNNEKEIELEEKEESIELLDSENSLTIIASLLEKQDWANAFSKILEYLRSIGKEDFNFLVRDLITIALIEGDSSYSEPLNTLKLLCEEDFKFDLFGFTKRFHEALKEKKIRQAEIYFNMINTALKLHVPVSVELLYKKLSAVRENKINSSFEEEVEVLETQPSPIIQPKEIVTKVISKPSVNVNLEVFETDKKMVMEKYPKLQERNIILLEPMDNERIKKLVIYLQEEYQDISPLIVGEENKEQIVLRYRPIEREVIDTQRVICEGRDAYNARNYQECIRKYLLLLQTFDKPKSFVFALLGFSYRNLNQKDLAIEYLTIANEIAHKEGNGVDYSEKILILKGLLDRSQLKPNFKMKFKDLDSDEDASNYYGFKDFEIINRQMIDTGASSVQAFGESMSLTPEQINIIRLVYAKRFYGQGLPEKGDMFLKAVEKSGCMTKKIADVVNEIRRNKAFYQYRQTVKTKKLNLSLLP